MGEHYKAEIIASIPSNEDISLYSEGKFTDLCRGPHVPSTGKLKVFKLTKLAGAYWRGDSRNEMLQRIYGTAWAKKDDLDAYLHRIEEAEKRDHRKLGRAARPVPPAGRSAGHGVLASEGLDDLAAGRAVHAPRISATTATRRCACPHDPRSLAVGEVGALAELQGQHVHTESEKRDFAIKPMNCPGHVLIFNSDMRSYRDLPLRYGEFGSCHRNEPSGRAARHHARARLHAGRRAHLLHERADPAGGTAFNRIALERLQDFGFSDVAIKMALRPATAAGQRRDLGPRRKRASRRHWRPAGVKWVGTAGRRRVLRPEDRIPPEGLDRPLVAMRHHAGRFLRCRVGLAPNTSTRTTPGRCR